MSIIIGLLFIFIIALILKSILPAEALSVNVIIYFLAVIVVLNVIITVISNLFNDTHIYTIAVCFISPLVEEIFRSQFSAKEKDGKLTAHPVSFYMGIIESILKLFYAIVFYHVSYININLLTFYSIFTSIYSMLLHVNIGSMWNMLRINRSIIQVTIICICVHMTVNIFSIYFEPYLLIEKFIFMIFMGILQFIVFMLFFKLIINRKTIR